MMAPYTLAWFDIRNFTPLHTLLRDLARVCENSPWYVKSVKLFMSRRVQSLSRSCTREQHYFTES